MPGRNHARPRFPEASVQHYLLTQLVHKKAYSTPPRTKAKQASEKFTVAANSQNTARSGATHIVGDVPHTSDLVFDFSMCHLQASFSTASHGSLDSIDDEIDFKIDEDLRSQIEQMGIQKREENTLEQLEVSSQALAILKAVQQHQHPHQLSVPHAACNTLLVRLIARLPRLQASTSEAESRGEVVAAFIGAALVFGVGIWNTLGVEKAQEFFAGYLLEQSLSVDNLFVFILVFRYFRAPKADQDKVLQVPS